MDAADVTLFAKWTANSSDQISKYLVYSSPSIYADGEAPTDAPLAIASTNGNFGWYFKKTGNTKINWYIQPSSSMKVR
jgi:hypothetical protein